MGYQLVVCQVITATHRLCTTRANGPAHAAIEVVSQVPVLPCLPEGTIPGDGENQGTWMAACATGSNGCCRSSVVPHEHCNLLLHAAACMTPPEWASLPPRVS